MRSVGYARVSSREQSENSHALEQQIERLKAAGVGEIFSDVDSGSKDKRPAFNEVMELVRSHLIDEVVVTRLDRLTRSLPTLRKALDTFRESGVNLRALDDSIDMKTAAGKFHLNMLGALAEMEVDRLSERVKHGWQHLRDRSCSNKQMIRMEAVEEAVIQELVQRAGAITTLTQVSEDIPDPPELQHLKSQLEGLERLGYNPALIEAKRQLQCQIQNFQEQIKSQNQQQTVNQDLLLWAFGDTELWKNLSEEDKKRAYRTLVSRIVVKNGKVVSVELKV